jgi:hypothetical protein
MFAMHHSSTGWSWVPHQGDNAIVFDATHCFATDLKEIAPVKLKTGAPLAFSARRDGRDGAVPFHDLGIFSKRGGSALENVV